MKLFLYINIFSFILSNSVFAQKSELPVYIQNNKLFYSPDSLGNRIPDFSYCGYKANNEIIPDVPVKIFIPNKPTDATHDIQKAIDYLSDFPLDENGFRGAILLDTGKFILEGRIKIHRSGIIIRGSGASKNGTRLIAAGKSRETLLRIVGSPLNYASEEFSVSKEYVSVNSTEIELDSIHTFKIGDNIFIRHPVTKEWIDILGMNEFGGETSWLGWKSGRNNIVWDRTIVAIDNNKIIIDAPITTALNPQYGGGFISKYSWQERIENIGIENLSIISEFDNSNPKDEDHCWFGITIENAKNCWVRQVNFKYLAGSALAAFETSKQITVEDCISEEPVSEIAGQRRYTFFTSGQQVLFQRCYAEYGYHDFAVGNFAAGPNAFVQCESHLPHNFSGTIDRWASGVLFDLVNIDGDNLSLKNREQDAQGAGWTAANSMLWQCSASRVDCYSPPTATNWAFGIWAQFSGNGYWYEPTSHIKPRSLFYAQLKERIGDNAMNRAHFLPIEFGSTSSPSVALAQLLSVKACQPLPELKNWINEANNRTPITLAHKKAKTVEKIKEKKEQTPEPENHIEINNGWLTDNSGIITGKAMGVQWWRGNIRPATIAKSAPHITRFVPGRTGTGLTDNIDSVAKFMVDKNIRSIYHNYGLWYDRRRDDHERVRRKDGESWPPFYEQPFARSGQGEAWDRLSKYDLTKPNYWYWSRLKEFANKADQNGLILIHQNYFQHNILEAGAHYADFPWRTANNINNTGLPEPPPYAGDKRIFMAEQFYDTTNMALNQLHRQYIRQCLENFKDNSNVIQMISEEYTGPLHFVEFWLDVIAEWQKETGYDAFIGLSTTKDVQDAILNDPKRSKLIDVIDIKYWQLRDDFTMYAPQGGLNLAPRQHARLVKPGKPSFQSVYIAVSSYRKKYPDKAVIYSNYLDKSHHWAVLLGSGSIAAIPEIKNKEFLSSVATMEVQPVKEGKIFSLINEKEEQLIYSLSDNFSIDLLGSNKNFVGYWIDTETGIISKESIDLAGGQTHKLTKPGENKNAIWIKQE